MSIKLKFSQYRKISVPHTLKSKQTNNSRATANETNKSKKKIKNSREKITTYSTACAIYASSPRGHSKRKNEKYLLPKDTEIQHTKINTKTSIAKGTVILSRTYYILRAYEKKNNRNKWTRDQRQATEFVLYISSIKTWLCARLDHTACDCVCVRVCPLWYATQKVI